MTNVTRIGNYAIFKTSGLWCVRNRTTGQEAHENTYADACYCARKLITLAGVV